MQQGCRLYIRHSTGTVRAGAAGVCMSTSWGAAWGKKFAQDQTIFCRPGSTERCGLGDPPSWHLPVLSAKPVPHQRDRVQLPRWVESFPLDLPALGQLFPAEALTTGLEMFWEFSIVLCDKVHKVRIVYGFASFFSWHLLTVDCQAANGRRASVSMLRHTTTGCAPRGQAGSSLHLPEPRVASPASVQFLQQHQGEMESRCLPTWTQTNTPKYKQVLLSVLACVGMAKGAQHWKRPNVSKPIWKIFERTLVQYFTSSFSKLASASIKALTAAWAPINAAWNRGVLCRLSTWFTFARSSRRWCKTSQCTWSLEVKWS